MKKTRGITLIALVITIIVLLILAGVTISSISGDDGILGRTKESKEDTEAGQEKELVYMAANSAKINNVEEYGIITEENLEIELDKVLGKRDEKYTLTKEEDNYIVTCLDSGRSYIIESSGIINGIEKIEPTNIDDWEYELDTETQTAVITKYKGTDTEVIIPNSIEGYKVIAIEPKGDCGLWDKSICTYTDDKSHTRYNYYQETITKIVVSEGIETIGAKTFWYSEALQECIIKEGTKVIGDSAFYYCKKLNNIEMPNTLKEIGATVFNYVYSLDTLVIPSSVTTVGAHIANSSYIKKIYVPKSVINLNVYSFYDPNHSFNLYYEGTQAEWESLNTSIYKSSTVLYNSDMNV